MKHIPDEVLDQLLEDCDKPEDILGAKGLLASLQKSILERILEAELTDHLGYCKHEAAGRGKLDVHHRSALHVKHILLKPIHPRWRSILLR